MADAITGQWGTVSFEIPDFLQDVRDAVNDLAEVLVLALEIANLVLEFVKAFIKGFLDPIAALIHAIIEEIKAIIRDLRQIGIYITGDWALLDMPPEDLRGGFGSYERRMIARLTDRSDPTRPDVSSRTKVLGFFGYLSADPSEIERLINFVILLLKLFGMSFFADSSKYPIPVIRNITYGPSTASVFNFGNIIDTLTSWNAPPQVCRVTWVTRPASMKHPLNPLPVLGPSGYVVTVSTFPEGLPLKYSRAVQNTDKKPVGGDRNKLAQPREYGAVLNMDRQHLVLHGGAEMLSFKNSVFEFNKGLDSRGVPRDGACQVYGVLNPASNEVVPLELLGPDVNALGVPGDGRGGEFLFQRAFRIGSGESLAQWFTGEFSVLLRLEDMPHEAVLKLEDGKVVVSGRTRPAANYYVRVWSVGEVVASGVNVPQWDFTDSTIAAPNAFKSGQPFTVDMKSGNASIGMPSAARRITFVRAHTQDYLRAVETALLILVLARADIPLLSEFEQKDGESAQGYLEGKWSGLQFALRATGLEDSRPLLGMLFPDIESLSVPGQLPQQWRTELFLKIRQLALDIYERTGPMPDAERAVVDATEDLRTVTWELLLASDLGGSADHYKEAVQGFNAPDLPLMDALNPDRPFVGMIDFGIAPNIFSAGVAAKEAAKLFHDPDNVPVLSAFRYRQEAFALWRNLGMIIESQEDDPGNVAVLRANAPPALRVIYEQFTNRDGELLIPTEWHDYFNLLDRHNEGYVTSSGDLTPVFMVGATRAIQRDGPDWSGAISMRGLLTNFLDGRLFTQASVALRIATAAFTRSPQDGEWIALRLFGAFPELHDFLDALENWIRTLAEAIKSIADTIIKYIEFVQSQIVELQQFIRRINALIQTLLSFVLPLPQFSGLMLLSDGTDGLAADLIAAQNKPSDSPRSYGAGLALVVPFGPSFIFDLIALVGEPPDPNKTTELTQAPDAVGIEQIEPAPGGVPGDEPDVL